MNPKSLANLKPLAPGGASLNPGGAPKGKRIGTWMAEFGEAEASSWPVPGDEDFEELPGNAQIALRRLRSANKDDKLALMNSEYVEPRARVDAGMGADNGSLLAGIALAIAAMKAAGIVLNAPEATDQNARAIDATIVKPSDERE
jgi:hypothetical protein